MNRHIHGILWEHLMNPDATIDDEDQDARVYRTRFEFEYDQNDDAFRSLGGYFTEESLRLYEGFVVSIWDNEQTGMSDELVWGLIGALRYDDKRGLYIEAVCDTHGAPLDGDDVNMEDLLETFNSVRENEMWRIYLRKLPDWGYDILIGLQQKNNPIMQTFQEAVMGNPRPQL